MSKVGIGVIGCGARIRDVLDKLFEVSDSVEIVALCDPSVKSVETTKSRYNIDPKVYDDYRDLVVDPDVQWVAVGSWNCFHREHVVAAFEAGKNVFCEKPLATNLQDCLDMYRAWKDSDCKFMIGFTLRYSPHYRKIKEIIDSGMIGKIVSLEFNETLEFNHGGYIMGGWRSELKNSGSHLLEKCCHDIDIVNWLVGSRVRRAASFGGLDMFVSENKGWIDKYEKHEEGFIPFRSWRPPNNPFTNHKDIVDNQVAIMEYENGVRATFHTNCCAGFPERRLYILGTEGAIRADVIKGEIELKKIGFDTEVQSFSAGVKGSHGGGDEYLSEMLSESIFDGKDSPTGMLDALTSAVTCFGIDKALDDRILFDYDSIWTKVDEITNPLLAV